MDSILLPYPFDAYFMVRALVAVAILGVTAPLIGTFVVQRRLSLIGDGLGHVAAAGVGLALWLNFTPQWVALITTVIAAIAIELIILKTKNSDTALSIIFYSGIAASITFAGQSPRQNQLQQFLFGSVLTISWEDIFYLAIICAVIFLLIAGLSRLLLSIAVDESSAKIAGVNIHILRIILICSVAFIVSISISITGLLLISAVMVVPVMSARGFAKNFKMTVIWACILGLFGSVLGLALARMIDLAPGGTIVLTHIGLFVVINILLGMRLWILRLRSE